METLILRDPSFRMRAWNFYMWHQAKLDMVLSEQEKRSLAVAGNYSQGAMFLDGAHLRTLALEESIDAITLKFEGFYFGRFDVRYADVGELKQG